MVLTSTGVDIIGSMVKSIFKEMTKPTAVKFGFQMEQQMELACLPIIIPLEIAIWKKL
jgi:hypothetical protein